MVHHQPEQQPPAVQRLRVRYTKRGRARFASSRDFGRAFERALRRAEVPMAYSSGYSPRPRISYANSSPTGAATEAEYLEIALTEECDPDKVRRALDAALPTGLDVVAVVAASGESLADQLEASTWLIDLGPVDPAALERSVETLLAADEYTTSRMTKTGERTFDVRAAIIRLTVTGPGELTFVGRHLAPLVRPDDIVSALRRIDPTLAGDRPAMLTRINQGRWVGEHIVEPFGPVDETLGSEPEG